MDHSVNKYDPAVELRVVLGEQVPQPDAIAAGYRFAWSWLKAEMGLVNQPSLDKIRNIPLCGLSDAGSTYWFNVALRSFLESILPMYGVDCCDLNVRAFAESAPMIRCDKSKLFITKSLTRSNDLSEDPPLIVFSGIDPNLILSLPTYFDIEKTWTLLSTIKKGPWMLFDRTQILSSRIGIHALTECSVDIIDISFDMATKFPSTRKVVNQIACSI